MPIHRDKDHWALAVFVNAAQPCQKKSKGQDFSLVEDSYVLYLDSLRPISRQVHWSLSEISKQVFCQEEVALFGYRVVVP